MSFIITEDNRTLISFKHMSFLANIHNETDTRAAEEQCRRCLFHIYDPKSLWGFYPPVPSDYSYMHIKNIDHRVILCLRCIIKSERDYIESLKIEELPLLINHVWLTSTGEMEYKKKLTAGVLV